MLNYYEFMVNKLGNEVPEQRHKRVSEKTNALFHEYKNKYRKKELYQTTIGSDSLEYKRSHWNLWVQILAKTKEQAKDKALVLLSKILKEEIPRCGYLSNGEFESEAFLSDKFLWIRIHTNQILLLLDQYNINPKLGLELGVSTAHNSCGLLRSLKELHLILVDPFGDVKMRRLSKTSSEKIARDRSLEFKDRTTWKIKTSVEAVKEVKDKTLDYAFIDALHTYEAGKEDIEIWLPKVKIGGLLIGHDYDIKCKGLKRAVQERFGDKFFHEGSVWHIQVTEEILNQ